MSTEPDTWEGRMAAKAEARRLVREAEERAREEAERAEYGRQQQEAQRAEFEAGPPDGCAECYVWGPGYLSPRYVWRHVAIDEGDCVCRHECHGDDPPWCGPVVIA